MASAIRMLDNDTESIDYDIAVIFAPDRDTSGPETLIG
jgi:hypothetical protein